MLHKFQEKAVIHHQHLLERFAKVKDIVPTKQVVCCSADFMLIKRVVIVLLLVVEDVAA